MSKYTQSYKHLPIQVEPDIKWDYIKYYYNLNETEVKD